MKTNGLSIFPEFTAKLGTDVTLVAFNMTRQTALGQNVNGDYLAADAGYYFALQERPGQLRFGADASDVGSFQYWNDLSWERLNNLSILNAGVGISPPTNNNEGFAWGRSSANMASILAQQPVLFSFHSKNMII